MSSALLPKKEVTGNKGGGNCPPLHSKFIRRISGMEKKKMIHLPDNNILVLLANGAGIATFVHFISAVQFMAAALMEHGVHFHFALYEDGSFRLTGGGTHQYAHYLYTLATTPYPELKTFMIFAVKAGHWVVMGCLPGGLCND